MADSLWGEEFSVPDTPEKTKKILNKISKPKEVKVSAEKKIKSKKLTVEDKLKVITEEVLRVLGKQKDNVIVVKTREQLHDYLDKCIKAGRIDIDTETNNSLDPITCKLMGPCLYAPGLKQAYIPINHKDYKTGERLAWQLTEQDIKEELQRIVDLNLFTITHNGKFDYQVLKCTCDGLECNVNWDTFIAAKVLDENEMSAGLKQQYISKIDPDQEKYDIEHLFEGVEYAIVDPEIFALYAATDSMMTDKLYEWQKIKFEQKGNEKLYNMFKTLEMPLVKVIAEMELKGMEVDQEYGSRLASKYHNKLTELDKVIAIELEKLKPQIEAWKLTPEANFHPRKKSGEGEGKSKAEQLEDPINLASPTQLAILFYDILKCPQVSKKSVRGTGEKELEAISAKLKLKLCDLLIERRELVKLLTTYIDVIPETAKIWPDGRIRTHFNQYGADTGRLSSGGRIVYSDSEGNQREIGGVNFQNIPSANREIRMLFMSKHEKEKIKVEDNKIILNNFSEVITDNGKKYVDKLKITDKLLLNNDDTNTAEYHLISDIQSDPSDNNKSIISIL